jgi:hypothetical protein
VASGNHTLTLLTMLDMLMVWLVVGVGLVVGGNCMMNVLLKVFDEVR